MAKAKTTEEFKWFGEGFDGFPRNLPDDSIEYSIYIVDPNLQDDEVRERLSQIKAAATALLQPLLKGFIWQRDGFTLAEDRKEGRRRLIGQTNFGDSIDDEWFIVYLLRELSKQFPTAWIRAVDTDGQFLLIEAADVLPVWLNPEITEFRVWLNQGKLLIIPLENARRHTRLDDGTSDNLSLDQALNWIADPKRSLQHSKKIEVQAFSRLQSYPHQIPGSQHHAYVVIPRKIAFLLHSKSLYVSPAVEAFYLRDPIAMKPLRSKDSSALIFPPSDLVTMSVAFTKVGFAQLRGQEFSAPPPWVAIIRRAGSEKRQSQLEVGMKLTCGFEMLVSDVHNQDNRYVREMKMLLDDLDTEDAQLPSDEEIRDWGTRDDDDTWLDIDYQEFDKELGGKRNADQPGGSSGFGDQGAQRNLRKIVQQFEHFLQDEDLDDMDDDDDDTNSNHESDDDSGIDSATPIHGGSAATNDEEDQFTAMMREMMGMPPNVMKEMMTNSDINKPQHSRNLDKTTVTQDRAETDSASEADGEGIRHVMEQTEMELREAGALDLHSQVEPSEALQSRKITGKGRVPKAQTFSKVAAHAPQREDSVKADTDDAEIDENLVKNLMQSMRNQAGMAGPASNLMSAMGSVENAEDEDVDR
ncbi:MAG: hypothetical protein OHK93_000045 [Ramalina farinacea]|uniref:Ecdysoneless n=1 Tax=Ramalina farinacea TaxID=258253 RepID=A0AA43QE57_9LECA|nr:hypothetical protein [Ramalina farinacea]